MAKKENPVHVLISLFLFSNVRPCSQIILRTTLPEYPCEKHKFENAGYKRQKVKYFARTNRYKQEAMDPGEKPYSKLEALELSDLKKA